MANCPAIRPTFDDRRPASIGQHHRHLQEHPVEIADIVSLVLSETFRAVAALQQESFTIGNARKRRLQIARFACKNERRKRGETALYGSDRIPRRDIPAPVRSVWNANFQGTMRPTSQFSLYLLKTAVHNIGVNARSKQLFRLVSSTPSAAYKPSHMHPVTRSFQIISTAPLKGHKSTPKRRKPLSNRVLMLPLGLQSIISTPTLRHARANLQPMTRRAQPSSSANQCRKFPGVSCNRHLQTSHLRAMRAHRIPCDESVSSTLKQPRTPTCSTDGKIFVGKSVKPEYLELRLANRHGLITGATGTGKTVSLQVLAEGFSDAGVPVFAADIKGDLSGVAATAPRKTSSTSASSEVGLPAFTPQAYPTVFWDVFGERWPSGPRDRHRHGPAPALSPARTQRDPGRRAQHHVPRRRGRGHGDARPRRPALDGDQRRRAQQGTVDEIRQRRGRIRSAPSSAACWCSRNRAPTSSSASRRSTSRIS